MPDLSSTADLPSRGMSQAPCQAFDCLEERISQRFISFGKYHSKTIRIVEQFSRP